MKQKYIISITFTLNDEDEKATSQLETLKNEILSGRYKKELKNYNFTCNSVTITHIKNKR